MLVSTYFDGQIKNRVSRVLRSLTWSKLTKISEQLEFVIKAWKMLFWVGFDEL